MGFTAGAGVLIAANQLKNFLRLDQMPRGLKFFEVSNMWACISGDASWMTAVVGIVTVLTAIGVKRYALRLPLHIASDGGRESGGLHTELDQPRGGPHRRGAAVEPSAAFGAEFSLDLWRSLFSVTFAMTLFALTEAISIARALALRTGQHIDSNQEFIGQGLSNIAGAFFSGYVATGSFNRSA